MKASQTTPSFKTNGNHNITKTIGSMDSLRVDTLSPVPSNSSSNSKGHKTPRSHHNQTSPSASAPGSLDIRRVPSSGNRHNRPPKVSPAGDRKGLIVPAHGTRGNGVGGASSGEHISDSLSTASDDEDFSDTDTDDEWEGCDVTEV